MNIRLKIMILIFIPLAIVNFSYDKNINYYEFPFLKWQNIKPLFLKSSIIEIKENIKLELVKDEYIETIFTLDERWIVKKYDKQKLYDVTLDEDGIPNIILNQ